MKHVLLTIGVVLALGLAGPLRVQAQRGKSATDGADGFVAFEAILERNIFDPQRAPARDVADAPIAQSPPPSESKAATEYIDLLGVWLTDRQALAFTQGSRGDWTGALGVGRTLADWRIADIRIDRVVLTRDDESLDWAVGQCLEHTEGDRWRPAAAPTAATAPSTSSLTTAGPPVWSSDLLQRMRERRQRETQR